MNKLPETLKPVMSLVLYNSESTVYVEEHKIKELQDNKFIFGPGKPARMKLLSKLLEEIKGIDKSKYEFKNFIPTNVIRFNLKNQELNLMWLFKRSIRKLSFDEKHNIQDKHLKSIPNLIFQVKGSELNVYAYKLDRGLKTKIYYAPFHNVYNDGRVCMGNAKIDWNITDLSELIIHIESMFFNSKFTHLNHSNFKNNINVIWDRNGFKDNFNLTRYNKFLKDLI